MYGDLISRKALLEELDKRGKLVRKLTANVDDEDELIMILSAVRKLVNNRLAVDAEPVRHGRWEHGLQCPFCNQIDTTKSNYCPNCGAKMDGEDMKDGKAN